MKYTQLLEDALEKIRRRIEICRKRSGNNAADFIEELKGVRLLRDRAKSLCDRDTAHWVAVLFLLSDLTGERKYRIWAGKILECMARYGGLWRRPTVDFLWLNYYAGALGHECLGKAALRERMRKNTREIIGQIWHEKAGVLLLASPIRYPRYGYESRVDDIATLPALWWLAGRESDAFCERVARFHCDNTRRLHVRRNFSTLQTVRFDRTSGKIMARTTTQGFSARSCWARGQAWAILGYAQAYDATRAERYLSLALKLFDWFHDHLPKDEVPFYDFLDPEIPYVPRDTSAAVIACAGVLRLLLLNAKGTSAYRGKVEHLLTAVITRHLTPVAPNDHRATGHLTEGCVGKFNKLGDRCYGEGIGQGVFRNGAFQEFSSPYDDNGYSIIHLMQCLYFEMKKETGLLDLHGHGQ